MKVLLIILFLTRGTFSTHFPRKTLQTSRCVINIWFMTTRNDEMQCYNLISREMTRSIVTVWFQTTWCIITVYCRSRDAMLLFGFRDLGSDYSGEGYIRNSCRSSRFCRPHHWNYYYRLLLLQARQQARKVRNRFILSSYLIPYISGPWFDQ